MDERKDLHGRIKSIYFKNFLTFDEITFYPDLFLNVIIGPNGNGKSSIVSGIVLGLGGDPKLLSRAKLIEEYIKGGKELGIVVLHIYSGEFGQTKTFERRIHNNGKSDFKIDGINFKLKEYLIKIQEFNIQINNLCQFLPQDRVQEFASMNAQEVLYNTIKSVCSKKDLHLFEQLKTLRLSQMESIKHGETNYLILQESTKQLDALKKVLECYDVRNKFLKEVNVGNCKLLWLEYDQLKLESLQLKNDLDNSKINLNKHKKIYEDLLKTKELNEKEHQILKNDIEIHNITLKNLLVEYHKNIEQSERSERRIQQIYSNYNSRKNELSDQENNKNNAQCLVALAQQDLDAIQRELGDESENTRLQHIENSLREMRSKLDTLLRDRHAINRELLEQYEYKIENLKKKLEHLNNIDSLKLNYLKFNKSDTYKAYVWLQNNKAKFSGKVYNPILLEVNVNEQYAKYFENTIRQNDLLAFICEKKSDVTILTEELTVKQSLCVTIGLAPNCKPSDLISKVPINNIRCFGFLSYLIDLIDGPKPILNYLCNLYNLQNIPISLNDIDETRADIPSSIRKYFAANFSYAISISKYTQEKLSIRSNVQRTNLIQCKNDKEIKIISASLITKIKDSDVLKNKCTKVELEMKEIEYKRNELIKEKYKFDKLLDRIKESKDILKKREIHLNCVLNSITSFDELKKTIKTDINREFLNIKELFKKRLQLTKMIAKANSILAFVKAKANIDVVNSDIIIAVKGAHNSMQSSQTITDNILGKYQYSEKKLNQKEREALQLSSHIRPNAKNFPYKQLYDSLPNSIDKLKEAIEETTARLNCMENVDQNIINEHETKEKEVNELKRSLAENKERANNIANEITALHAEFYPKLNITIDNINKYFGNFMEKMGYAGEILFHKNSDFDFDSYGIKILVQYKQDSGFELLDKFSLSGGERAVAIAIYTLSLQNLTNVPFRCVDEINQGMDANNERRIYELLINETTRDKGPQFFFVTPKLLPNLPFNERVAVHIVYNGKLMHR